MTTREQAKKLAVLRSLPRALSRFDRIEPLSPSKLFVLRFLACHKHGDVRASDIGPIINISPSGMTRIIDDLCTQGLLQKLPDRSDGRAAILTLTTEAHQLLEGHDDNITKKIAVLIDELGPEKSKLLSETLTRFLSMLE